MTFAREAWAFVLPPALAAGAALFFQWPRSALVLALLAALVLAFFRIPARGRIDAAGVVLAPANGTVTGIESVREPLLGSRPYRRVSTFLSVFNVHVQRSPAAGVVLKSEFKPGRKLAAFRPEAGQVNESHFIVIQMENGDEIGVKQIAGLVARRVVSYVEPGQELGTGELIGVIKFGSRVDLYFPETYEVLVTKGETLVEGLTRVAAGPAPSVAAGARSPGSEPGQPKS